MNHAIRIATLLILTGTSLLLAAATYPVILVRRTDTAVGNYVIAVPASSGNFRATVYPESTSGISQTCASMSWTDDNNNPQTSANVWDSSAKGGFVLPIRAKTGTDIWLNVNSSSGSVYTTLERL
jgi:hypothetical protein